MKRYLVCLMLLSSSPLFAVAVEDFRGWGDFGIKGTMDIDNAAVPWKLALETRLHDDLGTLGQTVVTGGVGYSLGGIIDFSVGFDWMHTAGVGGGPDRDEYRPWQSVGGNIVTGGAGFTIRTKLEERIESGTVTLRLRHLFEAQWPIIFTPPTAIFIANEIFFHLNGTSVFEGGLDQNRFTLGVKHPFAGPFQGTIGYMNQAFPNEMNHVIVLKLRWVFGA